MSIKRTGLFDAMVLGIAVCFLAVGGFALEAKAARYSYMAFLVDVSASMNMRHKSLGVTKLSLAKQVLARMGASIRSDEVLTYGAIMAFPGKAMPVRECGPQAIADGIAAIQSSQDDFPHLTDIGDAITRQFSALPEKKYSTLIVLISDGENNRGKSPAAVVRELQKQYENLDVCILSLADNPEGQKTLQDIVELAPGYNFMEDAGKLLDDPRSLSSFAWQLFYQPIVCYFPHLEFERGSAVISRNMEYFLSKLLQAILDGSITTLELSGHTDNTGSERANQRLSERRAAAAKDWLVRNGVNPQKISTRGYGSSMPRYDNATKEGRHMNRRVDINWQWIHRKRVIK